MGEVKASATDEGKKSADEQKYVEATTGLNAEAEKFVEQANKITEATDLKLARQDAESEATNDLDENKCAMNVEETKDVNVKVEEVLDKVKETIDAKSASFAAMKKAGSKPAMLTAKRDG